MSLISHDVACGLSNVIIAHAISSKKKKNLGFSTSTFHSKLQAGMSLSSILSFLYIIFFFSLLALEPAQYIVRRMATILNEAFLYLVSFFLYLLYLYIKFIYFSIFRYNFIILIVINLLEILF
jgi:hypothetical protein